MHLFLYETGGQLAFCEWTVYVPPVPERVFQFQEFKAAVQVTAGQLLTLHFTLVLM